MIRYVIFDQENHEFLGRSGCRSRQMDRAQWYQRKHAAIARASLLNVERSVPPGCQPNRYYQNRPQVVVRQYYGRGLVATYDAPPVYHDTDIDRTTGRATRVPVRSNP